MSLIEQWANNLDVIGTLNGSWIEAIAVKKYNLNLKSENTLYSIAKKIGISSDTGDYYHDIAIKLSNDENIEPKNGSYLERIVDLTTP